MKIRIWLVAGVSVLACACSNPEADKAEYFESGNKYAAEEKYPEAILQYLNAVQIDPKFGEAHLKLAEAYEKSNNIGAAAPAYIRAADALPDHRDAQIKATSILLLARQYEDARARATAFLQKHPQDVEVLLLRAQALAALKDPDSALTEIEEALKIRPNESLSYVNLGSLQLGQGRTQEAEAAFRQAVKLAPTAANPRIALGNFLWSAGRRDEAEQIVKEAIALEPRHPLANRMLAVLYIATKRINEAEQPLKVVAEVTGSPSARLAVADYYVAVQRDKDATDLLAKLAADPALYADAESRLATIEYRQERRDDAHKRLDGILKRAPNNASVLQLKARWLGEENRLDEALAAAKAAAGADPQSASARYVLASVHDRRREVADAIREYNEVLRLNPRAAEAQVQLSRLNLGLGNSEEALKYAESARQLVPGSLAVRVALVRGLLGRGELARASAELAPLVKGRPDDPVLRSLDGAVEMGRGNAPAARAAFEKALSAAPGQMEALTGLTLLDIRAKKPADAVARLDRELTKQPNSAPLLTLAATAHSAAGDQKQTEQLLRRAVAADPAFARGYTLLAQFYLSQRRLDEARAEFEAMVKRDRTHAGARTMVGVLLEAQNKPAEARKWYEETIAITDKAPVAANNLAFMYAESGSNLDQAMQLVSNAKQQLPDNPDVDDTLGWVYYKRDMAPLAVRPLEASVEKNPKNEVYLYHLGLVYAKMGQTAKAREMLESALKINPKFPGADVARQTLGSL